MKIALHYIHEHIDINVGGTLPSGVEYDPILEKYTIDFDHGNFKNVFLYQFQFGGFKNYDGEWLAQVGYGYVGERVILERRDHRRVHVVLTEFVYEDEQSQYFRFEKIKSDSITLAGLTIQPFRLERSSID